MAIYSQLFIKNISNYKSWIRKKIALLNLTNHQPDTEKMRLYVKDQYEAKYQYFINKHEKSRLKAL